MKTITFFLYTRLKAYMNGLDQNFISKLKCLKQKMKLNQRQIELRDFSCCF